MTIERDIQASLLFNYADERTVDVGTDNLPGAHRRAAAAGSTSSTARVSTVRSAFQFKFKAQNLIDETSR